MKEKVEKFINELLIFIEEDYLSPCHNFNHDLKYSVKEIDTHYNCDYRYLFDKYYNDFIIFKEKGLYENISIIYDSNKDDYFVEVDPKQVIGAEERKKIRQKELDEMIEKEMKLVEEGKLDEVNPATLWLLGIE